MLKSIHVLFSIVSQFNYEIYKIDVKTAFLNGNLEEDIYMHRSIYQAFQSWNIHFDQAIKSFDFEQNTDKPNVYRKCEAW